MKKILSLILACVMTASLLVGCGGGTDTPANASATTGNGESIVRMAISDIPVVDPAVAITESALILYPNVYDSLVWPKADGSVVEGMAESYTPQKMGNPLILS